MQQQKTEVGCKLMAVVAAVVATLEDTAVRRKMEGMATTDKVAASGEDKTTGVGLQEQGTGGRTNMGAPSLHRLVRPPMMKMVHGRAAAHR